MYGLPEPIQSLSPAEEQVMLAIWHLPAPVTSADAGKKLAHKGWADTTVLSFLARLERKGWLRRTRKDGRNVYVPCITLRAYRVYTARERLETVFDGSLTALMGALLSEQPWTQSQLEAAQNLLQEKLDAQEEYDLYDPYG